MRALYSEGVKYEVNKKVTCNLGTQIVELIVSAVASGRRWEGKINGIALREDGIKRRDEGQ